MERFNVGDKVSRTRTGIITQPDTQESSISVDGVWYLRDDYEWRLISRRQPQVGEHWLDAEGNEYVVVVGPAQTTLTFIPLKWDSLNSATVGATRAAGFTPKAAQ